MLSFPAAIKVYLCTVACDMRRSFDGLSMMAEHIIRCNPFSGHLLVFCNRRSDRAKILYWDRDGEKGQPELRSVSRELRIRFGPMLSMMPRRKRCVLPGVACHLTRGAQCGRGRNGAGGG